MNNNKFDINKFISPDVSFAPVYIWVWNDICTREIIDTQLEEMQSLGIRAFYILPEPKGFRPNSMPTNLEPEYLSDEYFELCANAFAKAKERGMLCWIYDEGGWPSGSACGKVVADHPEYASGGNYPDLLNKKATEYFIEITHKKYPLNSNVTAVFTDEPKAPSKPFNKDLADKYELEYGESILPYLPLIMGEENVTEENVHILRRWYDLCSRVFCENFLLPCKKWANSNALAFTGHLDKDHDPLGCIRGGNNFNLMRALRCLDIPGIDVIWRQLYPENKIEKKDDMNGYNGFFPRYASSAAVHNGTKRAMCEILGVAGAAVSYDIMRYTVGYLAVRGINIFNLFNFPLGRKDALLAQELPIYTQSQPYYEHLNLFNRYMERLSYISSLGERVCETALYYPVSDFQGRLHAKAVAESFDELGRALEDNMVDFDIVDDDVIQSAEISDGSIGIGNAKYKHIIIPDGAFIPQKTQDVLNEFVRNGGKVSDGISGANSVLEVNNSGLRAMHRKAENAEIFCLFREKGDSPDYQLSLPAENGYLLDLQNGKLQRFKTENGILNVSLAVGETAVILLTEEVLDAEDRREFKEKYEISNKFLFRKNIELIFNENGFDNVKHTGKASPIALGDWCKLIGSEYSGSCVYETAFALSDDKVGKEGEIDLGEVHFSASVYLNNQFFGTAWASPYRLKIPCGVLDKNNTLKVVVTNTSANRYVHTDYFDKWKTEELSPYFETEMEYAKDFVSGGLYGPVVIYTD